MELRKSQCTATSKAINVLTILPVLEQPGQLVKQFIGLMQDTSMVKITHLLPSSLSIEAMVSKPSSTYAGS
jgi:hypothetical protein